MEIKDFEEMTIIDGTFRRFYMDYFHGCNLIITADTIIFDAGHYAKPYILRYIYNFQDKVMQANCTGYLLGKLKAEGATKKDLKFYGEMLDYFYKQVENGKNG